MTTYILWVWIVMGNYNMSSAEYSSETSCQAALIRIQQKLDSDVKGVCTVK